MASSMPDTQYCSDAHGRDTDEESYIACSIASSTETADDLPGAGRTLGNLYSVAGRFLESRVGDVAERLGYGPRATVVRIYRQRLIVASKHRETTNWREEDQIDQVLKDGRHLDMSEAQYQLLRDFSSGLQSSKEKHKVEKYCKRMLGYVSSNVDSTKKQAIDYIIELAFEDEYVRESLKSIGAVNVLESLQSNPALWINYGAPLRSRARRALIVLGDTEVHTLALKIKRKENLDVCLKDLTDYLNHPTYSFVAIRYLRQMSSSVANALDHAARGIVKAINANCDIIEFEECDRILNIWMYFCFHELLIDKHAAVFEIIFRYAEKLPRTVNSIMFQDWLKDLGTVNARSLRLRAHYRMAVLIKGIEAVNGSGNADLWASYSHPDLQGVLPLLKSPADIALSNYAYTVCLSGDYKEPNEYVRGAEELKGLCDALAFHASSTDSQIRERAWHYVKVLLITDIYCYTTILKALSLTGVCYPADFLTFVEEAKRREYSPPSNVYRYIRHCDVEGKLLYLTDHYTSERYGTVHGCVTEHEIGLNYGECLRLCLRRGMTFSSKGHYPILAGHTVNGERAYLAQAHFGDGYRSAIEFITEGTSPEHLCIWTYKRKGKCGVPYHDARTPISLVVPVLRWAPDMYPEEFRNLGLDTTGPFSWKPFEEPSDLTFHGRDSELDTDSELEMTFAWTFPKRITDRLKKKVGQMTKIGVTWSRRVKRTYLRTKEACLKKEAGRTRMMKIGEQPKKVP